MPAGRCELHSSAGILGCWGGWCGRICRPGRHVHIQAQNQPTGITDLTTADGPTMLKTLHTYPMLFRSASLIRGGVETRPTAVDRRRGDFIRPTP